MTDPTSLTLTAGDKTVALPLLKGSMGAPCADIGKLAKETGYFTYDPGRSRGATAY